MPAIALESGFAELESGRALTRPLCSAAAPSPASPPVTGRFFRVAVRIGRCRNRMRRAPARADGLSEAARLFRLVTSQPEWIHRRVDRTDLESDGETTRRISFDVTTPSEWAIEREGGVVAPLMMLSKRPLRRLDVAGPAGSSLPLLSKADNGALAEAMIVAALRSIHTAGLTSDVRTAIREAVFEDNPDKAASRGAALRSVLPLAPSGRAQDQEVVLGLLEDLITNFMFAVLLPTESTALRTMVKVVVAEDIDRDRDPSTAKVDRFNPFAREARSVSVPLYVAESAASVHYEFRAPSGVVISDIVLRDEDDTQIESDAPSITNGFTAHLTGLEAGPPSGDRVAVTIYLDPVRDGLVRQTAWATTLVAFLFGGAWLLDDRILTLINQKQQGSLATVALAVPALFLSLQARRPEHAAVARALFPPRAANLASAMLLYGAALAVLVNPSGGESVTHWVGGLTIAQALVAMYSIWFYRSLSD